MAKTLARWFWPIAIVAMLAHACITKHDHDAQEAAPLTSEDYQQRMKDDRYQKTADEQAGNAARAVLDQQQFEADQHAMIIATDRDRKW